MLPKPLPALPFALAAVVLALGACDSSSSSSSGGPDAVEFRVVDGPIAGAALACDGVPSGGTELDGSASCPAGTALAVATGGTDVGFGDGGGTLAFVGELKGRPSDAWVTPLTTLAVALATDETGAFDPARIDGAVAILARTLGVEGLDLGADPIATVELVRLNAQINEVLGGFADTAEEYSVAVRSFAAVVVGNDGRGATLDLGAGVGDVVAELNRELQRAVEPVPPTTVVTGPDAAGAPATGAPTVGVPVPGVPVPEAPVPEAPVPGEPVPEAPVDGTPVPGTPTIEELLGTVPPEPVTVVPEPAEPPPPAGEARPEPAGPTGAELALSAEALLELIAALADIVAAIDEAETPEEVSEIVGNGTVSDAAATLRTDTPIVYFESPDRGGDTVSIGDFGDRARFDAGLGTLVPESIDRVRLGGPAIEFERDLEGARVSMGFELVALDPRDPRQLDVTVDEVRLSARRGPADALEVEVPASAEVALRIVERDGTVTSLLVGLDGGRLFDAVDGTLVLDYERLRRAAEDRGLEDTLAGGGDFRLTLVIGEIAVDLVEGDETVVRAQRYTVRTDDAAVTGSGVRGFLTVAPTGPRDLERGLGPD